MEVVKENEMAMVEQETEELEPHPKQLLGELSREVTRTATINRPVRACPSSAIRLKSAGRMAQDSGELSLTVAHGEPEGNPNEDVERTVWSRYSLVITPVNYNLFAVNLFLAFAGGTQLFRIWRFDQEQKAKAKQED
ncbi:unnamed protein product [Lampetra planeri]